jgi:hypothetical protein
MTKQQSVILLRVAYFLVTPSVIRLSAVKPNATVHGTFYGSNCYRIVTSKSVCHFHPSLIFASKAGVYQSGAPYKTPF